MGVVPNEGSGVYMLYGHKADGSYTNRLSHYTNYRTENGSQSPDLRRELCQQQSKFRLSVKCF